MFACTKDVKMNIKDRVQISFDKQKFMKFIDAELLEVSEGYCEIKLPFKNSLTQQNGYFHAGIIGTIADTAAGYAAYTLMKPNESVLSVEYKLNLLKSAIGEYLIARSEVVKAGKTLTFCSAHIYSVKNNIKTLCSTATVTLISLQDYNDKAESP